MPVHGVLCISALTVAKMKGDMYNMFFWWGGGEDTCTGWEDTCLLKVQHFLMSSTLASPVPSA